MITNLLLGLVSGIFSLFNSLLPSVSVPSWFTTGAIASLTTAIGNQLSGMSGVFPVVAVLTVLQGMLTVLPMVLGYVIFNWLWNKSPTIAGCSL